MSSFISNLESVIEERPRAPSTANLSHILGRKIRFDQQPRRIQKMILEAAAIESQLVDLTEKAKNSDSTSACEPPVNLLHLFKEYSSIVHDIDEAHHEMTDRSAPPELLVRWAIMIWKTTERMIPAVKSLADIQIDTENPEKIRKDIDEALKSIFVAYEPMDGLEGEITNASPLSTDELAHMARMTQIVDRRSQTRLLPGSDADDSEDDFAVYSEESDDDSIPYPRDNEGYLNLDEYEFSTENGRIVIKESN